MGLFSRRRPTDEPRTGAVPLDVEPEAAPSPADMDADAVLGAVKFRLSEASYVQFLPEPPADVVEFAPGIVRHLVLDLPDSVQTVPAEVMLRAAPLEALREAADRNTRAVLDETFTVRSNGEGPRAVHVVAGESPFTATCALYLPDLLNRLVPGATDARCGLVLAVPARHQIAVHVPQEARSTREVLASLARFARHGYEEGAFPVSPDLYQWNDGEIAPLTGADPAGPRWSPRGPLAELLAAEL